MDSTQSEATLNNPDDNTERRRLQNRLAQRAHRRNMREQKSEIERLKRQVDALQAKDSDAIPQTRLSESKSGNRVGGASCISEREIRKTIQAEVAGGVPQNLHTPYPESSRSASVCSRKSPGRDTSGTDAHSSQAWHFDSDIASQNVFEDMFLPETSLPCEGLGVDARRSLSSWPTINCGQLRLDGNCSTPSASLFVTGAREGSISFGEARESLLHLSIAAGHSEMLQLLLERTQSDINQRDSAGFTPLQRAVISGRTDLVTMLLEHGAEIQNGG